MSQRAGVRRAARRHRDPPGRAGARRGRRRSRWRTSTTASTTINGDTGVQQRARPARAARPGAGGEHRQRAAERLGQRRRSWCVAIDGFDVNEPTEVTDQGGRDPRRGSGRPGGPGADRRHGRARRRCSAASASSSAHRAARPRAVEAARGASVDLLDYGSPATPASTPADLDRKFDYSDRPQARLPRRQARACGGASTATSTRTCRCSWCARATSSQVTHLQPQRRGAPDAPARPPRARAVPRRQVRRPAARGGSTRSRCRTARPSRSPSSPTTPASGWTTATTSSTPREGMVTHLMYEGVTTPYKLGSDSGNTPE